ncbi:MAG: NUDIX hydrolase [Clostridia bacterium]|nr:NUDIX hydrolase [Clostridia bacterium]
MLYIVKNKKMIGNLSEEEIYLPKEIKQAITDNFNELKNSGLNIWNGKIMCVDKIIEDNQFVKVLCKKSDYAHYLYAEKNGLPVEYGCKSISAGCVLETKDGYFVVGELGDNTSYPGMLQTTGGNIDEKNDITNGNIDFLNTIVREAKEELNIDLKNEKLVSNHEITYMYIEEIDKQKGVRILSKATIDMTAKELQEHFEKYNEYLINNNLETEFERLHFLKKENAIEELNGLKNPKREYLVNILKYECENNVVTL